MSVFKKTNKSKFISEDIGELLNESQHSKSSPKTKKTLKRQMNNTDEDVANLKKKKVDTQFEPCKESRHKLLTVMTDQTEKRKQGYNKLFKSLSELLPQLEAEHNILKENEQKLEQLTGTFMKCIQQTTAAHKQKLKALKEIHASFKKECEEMEMDQKAQVDKLADELEEDINKLQQKLVSETKRSGWETLRKTIFQAMQNDF